MKMLLTKKGFKTIAATMIYYVVLIVGYIYWVQPNYAGNGFELSSDLMCMVISVLSMLFISVVISRLINRKRVTDIILVFLILLYFIPTLVLYANGFNDTSYYIFSMMYLAALLIFNRVVKFNKKISFKIKENTNLFIVMVALLSVFMIILSGYYTNFRITFAISDYYEYRYEAREYSLPTIFRYLFNWCKMVLPIGLVYAIRGKKRWLIALTITAEIFCFSFDGKKSVLFMFLLSILIALFYKEEYIKKFPLYMIFVVILMFVENYVTSGSSFIGTHIIRRMMFVPARLGHTYFEFFKENELLYLRSSILRFFGFRSPYDEGIGRIIGQLNQTSRGGVNANTGLLGDAFANFGWFSIILYPLMLIIVLKVLEKYLDDIDERMQVTICLSVAYSFMSGSFFTILLTNGVLIIIVMLMFMPRKKSILAGLKQQASKT